MNQAIELQLLVDYRVNNNVQAMQQLVTAHTPFIHWVARKHYSKSMSLYDDLVQEGVLGLIHAINKFDLKSGYKLISYAKHWIRAYMSQFLRKMYKPTVKFDEEHVAPLLPTQHIDMENSELADRLDAAVQKVLKDANEEDKYVFQERYTKDEQTPMREIGEQLGVSRQRVDQRDKRLLRLIREEI